MFLSTTTKKRLMNDAAGLRATIFPIFLVLISAIGGASINRQSIALRARMFSNNSYLRTINRAARQLLTENKSETRRRRFIADDLSLRKIIRHTAVQCNEKRPVVREAGAAYAGDSSGNTTNYMP